MDNVVVLSRIRHWLVLLLFVALPFHAFFVTVGTKLIAGGGQAPLPLLAVWKEMVISAIFLVGILEMFSQVRKLLAVSCKRGARLVFRMDREVVLIVGLLIIAFSLLVAHSSELTAHSFVFGFKYLFVPLIFFLVLKNLTWEEGFLEQKVFPALLAVGGVIAGFGIVCFFLPMGFFTALGYSDAHSIYAPGSSLSAFQQIGSMGLRRIQSTFAGPNQLGLWLLIPLSVGLVLLLRKVTSYKLQVTSNFQLSTFNLKLVLCVMNVLIICALMLTFSRSAWIAAFVITLYAAAVLLRGKRKVKVLGALTGVAVMLTVIITFTFPNVILRSISNRHHFERVQEGFQIMFNNPFGLGLGSAGPASNRTSDACLYFEPESDISWAADRTDLCLFVGGMQMQPSVTEKQCKCPLLPENWYVQVGIELGIAGFVLFLILIFILLYRLASVKQFSVFLAFLGISIAALFLHAWEDSAVAYCVWGIVGIALSLECRDAREGVST